MNKVVKTVAKLVMIDQDDHYLLMYRSEHPVFGIDPDLPGGTLEEGESSLEAMLREVEEEIGVVVNQTSAREVYSGSDYSKHGTHYALYVTKVTVRPEVIMSWEHSSYEWLSREEFIKKARQAKDTYMHMVGDVIASEGNSK